MTSTKTALICGVSGQDGAYLAQLLLQKGYRVIGTSRDATAHDFPNLTRLGIRRRVETVSMALNDFRSVAQVLAAAQPDEIYNLAGQTSVGLSFQQPIEALESITLGTINILEAIRFIDLPTRLYNAGSSECFGDTGGEPANEETAFRPLSPYATAKAASYWTVSNYREAYGIEACTGILFNHESPLRPKRFVTKKIIAAAVDIHKSGFGELLLGNLDICRDWGWAPEYVEAMWRMLQQDYVEDFVIATGISHSLREFCDAAFSAVGLRADDYVNVSKDLFRPSDIALGLSDPTKARQKLGWSACFGLDHIVEEMVKVEMDE